MDGRGRMGDRGGSGSAGRGEYEINLPDGMTLKFNDVELAPPCGAFAVNYSR